jgi:hypothetical protein
LRAARTRLRFYYDVTKGAYSRETHHPTIMAEIDAALASIGEGV